MKHDHARNVWIITTGANNDIFCLNRIDVTALHAFGVACQLTSESTPRKKRGGTELASENLYPMIYDRNLRFSLLYI